jgi:tetratricopeptide (TPR) repeat protein
MMKTAALKYLFFIISAFLLFIMIYLSRGAGISCDDALHYDHSLEVYNYFASHGKDRSALETPLTHLRYYGQSYDNIVTLFIKWFDIADIYVFRHLMSSLAGWLAIFLTALFGCWLSGYRTGIIVLLLFAVSPTFTGHSLNNLKDIPFALSYIAGLFFTLRMLFSGKNFTWIDIILIICSTAFSISIRAGGILLICYLFLFFFVILYLKYINRDKSYLIESGKRLVIIILISGTAFFMGILLWPYALQSPFRHVFESYRVMAHFPDTFRQIFEGKNEWSDFMPWYYLPKSMAITIPVIVLTGIACFFIFLRKLFLSGKILLYGMILFALLFPMFFVIFERSNLYSSWRQFLFLYPVIIVLSATGFSYLIDFADNRFYRWGLIVLLVLLSMHPFKFMIKNHPYHYLYYNQLVGGLKGAYGRYETDYYYVSQTKASEWLIGYLQENRIDSVVVMATYPVGWSFRNQSGIKTSYFRYEERSQYDWDFAIVANRYINPYQLLNRIWPPENAIHIIYADGVPIGAVLERKSKAGYFGYKALEEGRSAAAVCYFEEALKFNESDELIFYNFARALNNEGFYEKADSVLRKGLEINPFCEPILMYLGNIAKARNNSEAAAAFYERLIGINRKYFGAYVELSGLLINKDLQKARRLLRTCLTINPGYKPAIIALAETYRTTNPDIAAKYYKMADTIK